MKSFVALILLAFVFGGVVAGISKRSIPDVDVSCIEGLGDLLEQLYDLVSNNDVTNMCLLPTEENNAVCDAVAGPLGAVVGKIDEVVDLLCGFCEN